MIAPGVSSSKGTNRSVIFPRYLSILEARTSNGVLYSTWLLLMMAFLTTSVSKRKPHPKIAAIFLVPDSCSTKT